VNDRARSVKVHAYLIHFLRKQMPTFMGRGDKQRELIDTLERQIRACARRYGLPDGDFPKDRDLERFRKRLSEVKDITRFPKLDKSMVAEMDRVSEYTHGCTAGVI
jgi:EH domain-containing protein 2